jgi:putative heme iron utilization protein
MTTDGTDTSADIAGTARRLARVHERGALATVDAAGWPHASLVLYALDDAARAVMLLSDLAQHTKNLLATGRAALLVDGTGGAASALTGPRLTIAGVAAPTDDEAARRRLLARHPHSAAFAGFRDMRVWRIEPVHGLFVAGFGAIHRLGASDLQEAAPPALAAAEAGIVAHMNEDHGDALDLYASRLLGLEGGGWRMTGIDADGIDLRRGDRIARLDFPEPVADAMGARRALVDLVGRARSAAAS